MQLGLSVGKNKRNSLLQFHSYKNPIQLSVLHHLPLQCFRSNNVVSLESNDQIHTIIKKTHTLFQIAATGALKTNCRETHRPRVKLTLIENILILKIMNKMKAQENI